MSDATGAAAGLLAAALGYAARGWPVFPCKPRGKTPLTAHGFKDATCRPALIERHWRATPDANIGISTGPAHLLVVDIDPLEGRTPDDLLAIFCELDLRPTFWARTPSGGDHLVYSRPPGLKIGNSAGKLAPGLDIRAVGGYIVAPPSVTDAGAYRWRHYRADLFPQVLSAALVRALTEKPAPIRRPVPVRPPPGLGTRYGLAALQGELEELAREPEGSRNDRLNAAAFALGQLVAGGQLADGEVVCALTDVALSIGLDAREVAKTIASGMRAGLLEPRRAS